MRKYRNEIFIAAAIIILNIVICTWSGKENEISYYENILRQFHYQALFSALLFLLLYDEHDPSLIYVRHIKYAGYIKQSLKDAMKRYGILMILVTAGQWIIFEKMDSLFHIKTLIYINSIFFVLINFVKYFLLTLNRGKQKMWIICIYTGWFLLFRSAFDLPDHPLQAWNPFSLIQKNDGTGIIRNMIILTVCICVNQFRMIDHERFMRKWLE